MKFQDLLNILLLRSLLLIPAKSREYTIKGFTIYFPPEDVEDLEWIYHAIPIILQRPWPLKELLVHWPPKFPLFMADARHPLVTEHYLRLNSHPDITTALCTLNSSDPSRQSFERHLSSRGIRFPPHRDVFSTLGITNRDPAGYRYPKENRPGPGWQSAIDRINEILHCPAALANLRSLEVDIDFVYSEQTAKTFVGTVEVAEVSVLLSRLINSAPKLESLSWQAQCKSAQFFERDFELMGVRFDRIRHLTLGPFSDFMVRFAPKLESLESGTSYESRCRRNMLTRFSFGGFTSWWTLTTGYIKGALGLIFLSIFGVSMLGPMKYMPGMEKVLQSYLKVISHLPSLRTLKLPPAYGLGLGLDNSPRCGNIYEGPEGRAYGRQESRQRAATVELASRFALQEMPCLAELAVGGDETSSINHTRTCVGVTNGTAKIPEVRWPWTGRMEEWTFEEWPLHKPGWW
ncbi:hypothetical protein QBC37DRAFT_329299 [Rhypophila decipiens]|uniref:Uncharacterized protein n=1 Tax=Rhypophila decipiens TaxID=261697 RepID=A0AAN7AYJ1_9PEZI|nr:hypothetical protein QBC37DRAFT_329299 [Rhypophila decipiens]